MGLGILSKDIDRKEKEFKNYKLIRNCTIERKGLQFVMEELKQRLRVLKMPRYYERMRGYQ